MKPKRRGADPLARCGPSYSSRSYCSHQSHRGISYDISDTKRPNAHFGACRANRPILTSSRPWQLSSTRTRSRSSSLSARHIGIASRGLNDVGRKLLVSRLRVSQWSKLFLSSHLLTRSIFRSDLLRIEFRLHVDLLFRADWPPDVRDLQAQCRRNCPCTFRHIGELACPHAQPRPPHYLRLGHFRNGRDPTHHRHLANAHFQLPRSPHSSYPHFSLDIRLPAQRRAARLVDTGGDRLISLAPEDRLSRAERLLHY